MRDLGFDEVVGWSFTDPGEPGRLRIPAGRPAGRGGRALQPALRGPVGDADDRCSARCSTSPSATSPAAPTASPSSSPAASTCRLPRVRKNPCSRRVIAASASSPASFPGERPAPAASRTGSAAWRSARCAAKSWRGGGEPADFFALKGALEALAGQLGVELSFEPAEEPFLHPGPRGSGERRRRAAPAGSASCTRSSAGAWDLEAAVAFEVDLAVLLAAATAGEETFEDVTTFPAVHQDLAVVVPDEVPAAAGARAPCSAAAASCCAPPRSSTSTRASRSARAARASPCGSSSAPPTARSPTRRSPRSGPRSRPSWQKIGGSLRG